MYIYVDLHVDIYKHDYKMNQKCTKNEPKMKQQNSRERPGTAPHARTARTKQK